ncbi:MAG: very short patch repair endonuclease [Candidatus Neomarinimicrobiota bacterium]|jgi:DNA mismatch endonuclease (patch repair protein)
MDKFSLNKRNKIMRSVKNKGTKIECMLGKSLWKRGLRYRKNSKYVYGKPDFSFKGLKVAVFCDGEFWHGRDWETKKFEIKSNKKFWYSKIERNIERDREVNEKLINNGWIVLRFWESDILKNLEKCSNEVEEAINVARSQKN